MCESKLTQLLQKYRLRFFATEAVKVVHATLISFLHKNCIIFIGIHKHALLLECFIG